MRTIEINETLDLPLSKTWNLFTDLKNYPKYFKYVNKVFYNGEVKAGLIWYDFATFILPIVVKHKITVFEKEKSLGFDVYTPFGGYIKERINFDGKNNSTRISGSLIFDFGNPLFSFLFDNLFEKRMRNSISGALARVKKRNFS